MKKRPKGFRTKDGLQWACALLEQCYGTDRLDALPMLMSGYASVHDHPASAAGARGFAALRRWGVSLHSAGAVRQAVRSASESASPADTEDAEIREPPYTFNSDGSSFQFVRTVQVDPRPENWVRVLLGDLPPSRLKNEVASLERTFSASSDRKGLSRTINFDLRHLAKAPPDPPRHDLTRRPSGPLTVSMAELMDIAGEMDAVDATVPGRVPRKWVERFVANGIARVELLRPAADHSRLIAADSLDLAGIRHLIGLPGSGKSTLVTLLMVWAHRRGLRFVLLVPSITDAMRKIEEVADYGVTSALLSGQGGETRSGHHQKLIQRLGAREGRGFGLDAEPAGSRFLATGCALEAFDDDPRDDRRFNAYDPPCSRIDQMRPASEEKTEPRKVLCPLSGWCGRMEAARSLVDASVWVGHVLSLDIRVPGNFCDEEITYFELVSRTADIVVVDEADGAQHALDVRAITKTEVVGTPESIQTKLLKDLAIPFSSGRNSYGSSNVANYQEAVTRFIQLSDRLVNHIQSCRRRDEGVLSEFEKGFLTGNRVASALYPLNPSVDSERERFGAITHLMDTAILAALYGRDVENAPDTEATRFDPNWSAEVLLVSSNEAESIWREIRSCVQDWLVTGTVSGMDAALDDARAALYRIAPTSGHNDPAQSARITHLFRFWVEVIAVVTQFVVITQAQRAMVAEGVLRNVFFQKGISESLARSVPEALLGRLAGLSYEFRTSGGKSRELVLTYLEFRGAPRISLHRLNGLFGEKGKEGGPNVLLTSATSYLRHSPSYHIDCGPHYVLRRSGKDASFENNRFAFVPLNHPYKPKSKLFFSGAGSREDRMEALRIMAKEFCGGLEPRLERMNRNFEPGRLTGFVVNGYDQVRAFKEHAEQVNPTLGRRIVGVVRDPPTGNRGDWITAAQVESLGVRDDWDAVVFPMKSLARGVNIVRSGGPADGRAALGTIAFLTRPHPASESVDFVAGLVGTANLEFDRRVFPHDADLDDLMAEFKASRAESLKLTRSILIERLLAIRMDPEMERRFVADLSVDFIQTMGRGVRNGSPVRVLFVDAAWSRGTVAGRKPTAQDSTLVMMRELLRDLVASPGAEGEIYRLLYEPFLSPLERCEGLFPIEGDDDEFDA